MPYRCAHCGEIHEGLPDLGFGLPDAIHALSELERAERAWISDDLCVLDSAYFFIRGFIEIPVHGESEGLGIGVWVTQSEADFLHYQDHFHDEAPAFGPFAGSLANDIVSYETRTLHLKTTAHFRRERPRIEVEPTDHPLARDQRDGITLDRAWEMVHRYLG